MTKISAMMGGLSTGAALMYFLDPVAGRRRRALLRDKAVSTSRKLDDALRVAREDLNNRASGISASVKGMFSNAPASPDKLERRVRSKLGRYSSHPRAIQVEAHDSGITLSGHILEKEVNQVLMGIARVSGVKYVENKLEAHPSAEEFPQLQGGVQRTGESYDLFQSRWAPSTRLLVFAAAIIFAAYGLRRSGVVGASILMVAMALMAEAASNKDLNHLFGMPAEQEQPVSAAERPVESAQAPSDEPSLI